MIGFFGGTFDPIHLGHINLAISLYEKANLEQVWFCPAFSSPFKRGVHSSLPEDRFKMISLAIKGIPDFKVIDFEIKNKKPSFTIDTLEYLLAETNKEFRLLLGEDQLKDFHLWKDFKKLSQLAPPLVGARSGTQLVKTEFETVEIPLFDISATSIRERVRNNQYINHLTTPAVVDYISKQGLYLNGKK